MVKIIDQHLKGVDVFKLIMAMCVVAIHAESAGCVRGTWPPIVEWLIRLAVPFFFITSGYLTATKLLNAGSEKRALILRRAKKIIRIFLYWICIYFPISLFIYLQNGQSFIHNAIRYLWQLLISGESKYAYPLWYLYSLSIVLVIYALLCKVRKIEYLLFSFYSVIITIGWLAHSGLIANEGLLKLCDWISTLTSRTLGGGIYVMVGILMLKRNFPKNYCLAVCSVIISLILYWLALPFWELFGGIAIFIIACSVKSIASNQAILFRSASMWIYYTHMYVIFSIVVLYNYLGVTLGIIICYIIASTITVLLTLGLLKLQMNKKFYWLKRLVE